MSLLLPISVEATKRVDNMRSVWSVMDDVLTALACKKSRDILMQVVLGGKHKFIYIFFYSLFYTVIHKFV